jgi:hypothetical protein
MPILIAIGKIMDVAPTCCESIAIWAYKGFNTRYAVWNSDLPTLEIKCKYLVGADYPMELPWQYSIDAVLEIVPEPYKKLKYLYFFSNPGNRHAYTSFEEIDKAINRCLDKLASLGVKTVAMIHIPATENEEILPSREDDIKSAKRMIAAIRNFELDSKQAMDFYLVDRAEDFGNYL